jgi:putative chitinase
MDREAQVLSAAVAAGITSPRELANFMAQVTHESHGLNRLEEGFRYTKNVEQIPVQSAWRHGRAELEAARMEALQGKPEHLAELMYGGRNGNNEPGDGFKYHGRGYIQLTGKDNYRAAGEALHLDLVKHPELAAEPENAARIAVWYWETRVPKSAHEDVRAATQAINGGLNGLDDRQKRFAEWEKKLTPEVMERLEKGQVGVPYVPPSQQHPKSEHPAHGGGATLREKDHGQGVRELQDKLRALGYDGKHGPLKADGHFGPNTREAVEAFQRDLKLTADGVAGPRTLAAIERQLQEHKTRQASPHLGDTAHPSHGVFQQALNGMQKIDAAHQRTPDQLSQNAAASLVVAAHRAGLSRIDHVVMSGDGSRLYAVQGELNSPLKRIADVQTQQAIHTPMEQSSRELAQASQQHASGAARQQAHEMQQNQAPTQLR